MTDTLPLNPAHHAVLAALARAGRTRLATAGDVIASLERGRSLDVFAAYKTALKFLVPSILKLLAEKGVVEAHQPQYGDRTSYSVADGVRVTTDGYSIPVGFSRRRSAAPAPSAAPGAAPVVRRQAVAEAVRLTALQYGRGVTVAEVAAFCADTPEFSGLDQAAVRQAIGSLVKTGSVVVTERIAGKGPMGINRVAPPEMFPVEGAFPKP